jgi:hypothetical protein
VKELAGFTQLVAGFAASLAVLVPLFADFEIQLAALALLFASLAPSFAGLVKMFAGFVQLSCKDCSAICRLLAWLLADTSRKSNQGVQLQQALAAF